MQFVSVVMLMYVQEVCVQICNSAQEAVRAQKDGFDLVQDMLEYNFPTSIWAHGKQEPPDESVFDLRGIETHDWFDDRMRTCCHVSTYIDCPSFSYSNDILEIQFE